MPSEPSFARIALRSFPFVFGAVLLAIAVPVLIAGVGGDAQERALKSRGVVTDGTVLDKESTRTTRQKRGGATEITTTYSVRYRFGIGAGAAFEAQQPVSEETWKPLHQNDRVAVRYLPDDPAVNRLDAERQSGRRTLAAIGGLVAAVGVGFLAAGILGVRRIRGILLHGVPAKATVTAIDTRSVRGRSSYVIRYRYHDEAGADRNGCSLPLAADEVAGWKVGATARIRVDPRRPERSAWVGKPA
jgi:hypothetical protein